MPITKSDINRFHDAQRANSTPELSDGTGNRSDDFDLIEAALEISRRQRDTLRLLKIVIRDHNFKEANRLITQLVPDDDRKSASDSRLISFVEAGRMLGLNPDTIRTKKGDTGSLTHVRFGRRIMVLREEVEALLNQRIQEGREKTARIL